MHSEILNFLKKKHPGNDENDYLWEKIFEEAFDIDGRNDKSFKQLAEHFKLPESSFFKYYFVPMMKAVKEFLKSQGYHGDKKEVEKEIEEDLNDELKKTPPKEKLPDYQTYLKEPQNSKEFKEYLHKNRSTRMSPRTVKIVELFGEGLTNKEIVDKLPEVKLEETHRTKSEAFNKFYKNWYEEKMEKQLEDKEKVAGFFMPYMRVDSEKKEPASIYKRMADSGRMGLLIEFNSDYTKQDVPKPDEKGKIPDPNFEFQSLIYTLNNFKKKHSLEYRYIEKPKDKAGNLEKGMGGESLLKLDGKPSNDHEVKKEIDDRIEKLKQEGIYPHISGLSVTYKNTNKKYPGSKGIYKGVQSFDSAFADLAPNDDPHKERSKNFNQLQLKKKVGPGIGQSTTLDARRKIKELEEELESIETLLPIKALKDTQHSLEKEEAKPAESQDRERIKSLKDQVESYKELIQNKKLVERRDEIHELISELNKFVTHKTIQPDTLEEYDDIKERVKEFHESDFVKDELKEIRDDLKEEKEKPVEEQDKDYIKQLDKEEQGLLKLLRDQENMDREADAYGDLTKHLPPPDAKVKELIKLFEDYGLKASELQKWTEPKDLKVLAKTLANSVNNTMETELKKEKDEAAKTEIVKKHNRILSEDTVKLFEDVPKDLKRRRDELKSRDPAKFNDFLKNRNVDWVDDTSTVGSIMSYVKDVLLIKEKGKINIREKGPSFTVMPKADYKDLANHLHLEQMSLNVFADRFSEMPLTLPKGKEENKGEKILNGVEKELEATEQRYKAIQKLVKKIADEVKVQEEELKKPESKAEAEERLKELEEHAGDLADTLAELPKLSAYIKLMRSSLSHKKDVPVKGMAKIILNKLDYFSKLYSKLSRCIWARYKTLLRKGAEAEPEDVSGALEDHRREAVDTISHISGLPITDGRDIKKWTLVAKARLKKFLEMIPSSSATASIPYGRTDDSDELAIFVAEEDYGKSRLKAIIPEKDLHDANQLIKKFKDSENRQLSKLAPGMQDELDEIMANLAEAYNKKYFSLDRIKEYAEKEKMPFQQAAVRLKKLQDVAAISAVNAFSLKWEDYLDARNKPKTRSDLGNKPGKKYRLMGKYIEKALPELATMTPPSDDFPEEPKHGVPTPTKIRELIEEQFSDKEPDVTEQTRKEIKNLFYEVGKGGGGGGGKSKGRSKPVKLNPPNVMKEESKDELIRVLEKESPVKVVTDHFLLPYATAVRKSLKEAEKGFKNEEYLDIDSVVDGFIDHLKKQWNQSVMSLKVDSPILNPKGSLPDIRITKDPRTDPKGALKEVQDWRKIFEGLRHQINVLIYPDTIGVPPKNLSGISKDRKYFPSRLLEIENEIQNIIDKKPFQSPHVAPKDDKDTGEHLLLDKDKNKIEKHPGKPGGGYPGYEKKGFFPMSLRIMSKFAGTGIQNVEYSDEDILT